MIEERKKLAEKEIKEEKIVRILAADIEGNKNVYTGLTKIKGISWGFSNAICRKLGINHEKEIGSLSDKEIKQIEEFVILPEVPVFLLNRKKDRESGKDMHLLGADLSLRRDFDIKRLKKIKAYKGIRHALGQPVRGQRTRAHFRKNKSVGVIKKAKIGKKG